MWKSKIKRRWVTLFEISESAYQILQNAIKKECDVGEKLFVRLTMGIG